MNDRNNSVAVQVRNLRKSFRLQDEERRGLADRLLHPVQMRRDRELQVLRGISFDIKRGELFGIVGRNGSGKSTLLRVLASIYRADAGTVKVAGRLAPFIELGVGFDQDLSARENVMLNGVMLGIDRRVLRRRLDEILEFAELTDFADVQLKNFSSGMRVRLAFAGMIQAEPDVFLVDEILAVGDAAFQEKCLTTFMSLREQGRTIVLVTHRQPVIERYADRALLLEDGQINLIGAPDKVARQYLDLLLERRETTAGGALVESGRTARAEIVDVWLVDDAGRRGSTVGDVPELELRIGVEASGWIRALGMRFELRNERGVKIFAPPDSSLEGGTDVSPGEQVTVAMTLENRLTPGRYVISLTVLHSTNSGMAPVSPARSFAFEVSGHSRPTEGLVAFRHRAVLARDQARAGATL